MSWPPTIYGFVFTRLDDVFNLKWWRFIIYGVFFPDFRECLESDFVAVVNIWFLFSHI